MIWLSQQQGKAILKLTQRDYADARMSSLVAKFGSPGEVNGKVFNVLGAKIRGKSKLPVGRKIICFSPHPDDDVISMGGILRKLTENDNDVTVAYMTSGNIAVFDHDVRRYVDFLERLATEGRIDRDEGAIRSRQKVARVARTKASGRGRHPRGAGHQAHHSRDGSRGRYRNRGPASQRGALSQSAVLSNWQGAKRPDRSGRRRDRPRVARGVQPDLIFVAGDLSDPHGTHRMCKEAIDRALRRAPWHASQPEVWLYRGAWQEWAVHEATWLVPLSQEELRLKIQAIFKHQSQKDSAPFPGGYDDREFWQRVEARNKGTAAELDRLGLAEYFAMEAYVVE